MQLAKNRASGNNSFFLSENGLFPFPVEIGNNILIYDWGLLPFFLRQCCIDTTGRKLNQKNIPIFFH